ncbi:GNAT family N-acetyltransferase [Alkalicaulis satelles]|uniref:GNAT family N-acetyltransferase n=1 Tax=Alkalicaulis satelles TaxID=2609175 RepID=A0A5M6ZDB4_9PROT|nr:GNAT family N-acetyltransferase [Alkalicaulis satelles]KAA5802305.1 GNAT family N-acetyltransferase [Alkalicaulis satelles]
MTASPVIETARLRLRVPQESDFAGFCALMSDPEAARHIGGTQPDAITWRNMAALMGHWQMRGYGFFSVEEKATGQWVGRVGPWNPHQWPAPEVGWSILRAHWGKGYGPEAAAAALDFVFDRLRWERVIHLIAKDNINSAAVARKLGSTNTGEVVPVPGFDGVFTEVWAQSRADWAANRAIFADVLRP